MFLFVRFCIVLLFSAVVNSSSFFDTYSADEDCSTEIGKCERIFGGAPSIAHSRPFQAAISTELEGSSGFCGGVLLSRAFVLTAAHCTYVNGEPAETIRVMLGTHMIYQSFETGRVTVPVSEVILHPEWESNFLRNDIALLRLSSEILLTETVFPVKLPPINLHLNNFAGYAAIVSGWGQVADGMDFLSPMLRQAIVRVTFNSRCQVFYPFVDSTQLCTEAPQAPASTCTGDNGGPLTIEYREETYLIGVATFVRRETCDATWPSVFMRLTSYLSWIYEVAGIAPEAAVV